MDNTAVQATEPTPRAPLPELAPSVLPVTPSVRRHRSLVRRALEEFAGLRLTVILFVCAIVLVFCGTLAQVDLGIWTAVNRYFRSAFVWIPFQIFVPRSTKVGGGFPFPGGWLIGGLLLANLLAAHAIRFRLQWKRSGILILHSGLILLMLSELVTGLFAIEGHMRIMQGGSARYVEHQLNTELAILATGKADSVEVLGIPQSHLRKGAVLEHESLPFEIQVGQYMVNSRLLRLPNAPLELATTDAVKYPEAPPGADNPATAGLGKTLYLAQELPEVSGVEDQKMDVASAYVTLRKKGTSELLGTYLVSLHLIGEQAQYVTVGDRKYELALRFQRSYKPFAIHLIEFRHDKYPGTEKPKNFSSKIRLVDPTRNEDREVLISMNDPLRYRGETFYQASFVPGDRGTILQVVRNPGWRLPYVSCIMVTLGMLIHFSMHLFGFLSRRAVA